MVDQDDPLMLQWLQQESTIGLLSYLSDLEYMVFSEFHDFLHFPIVMYNFKRFLKSIDIRVKVFGMGHGVVPVTATGTLSHVQDIDIDRDIDTKNLWKSQIFFAVRCALKRDYFDHFLSIHSYLDSFDNY